MKTLSLRRLIAMLLVFAMLLPMFEGLGSVVTAADGGEETVYVLAGSDFQDSTDELSAKNVSAILERVFNAGYTSFDGFMFCGDYSNQSAWTKENSGSGLDKLKGTVEGKFGTIPHQYYVQGNHDPSDTPGLSQSIGYKTDHYSVFVLNEDDYSWHGEADEEKLKNKVNAGTADRTDDGLKEFLDQQTVGEKPVFVLAHVPLHYSWRTDYIGDAQYAKYIVDVLNEAGQRGLNIIFMYGHNHGGGLDNYLGGSTNYIPKGDTMYIADPLSNEMPSVARTINFTYMNAGMVGYYNDTDYDKDGSHVDGALTMSVFAITGDDVVVRRFCGGTTKDSVTGEPYCTCADGKHMVKKSAGDWYDENEEKYYGYKLNTNTFISPQTISGSSVEVTVPSTLANNEFTVGSSAVVAAPSQQGYHYSWESSNPEVATVSAMNSVTALITGHSEGSAKITVTKSAITRSASAGDSTSFFVQVVGGEGVVVEDSGEKIFRRTHTFEHGKRYIISSWPRESWNRNDIATLMAPDSGYGPTIKWATSYMYPDGVPYFTQASVASNSANIWRFETSGTGVDDEGYLISERTGDGYSGVTWYLGLGTDMRTIWVTQNPTPGSEMGPANSRVYLASAEWSWGSGVLNTETSAGETYWLTYHNTAENWQSISGSEWDKVVHRETYIFEETNNVATAILSNKVGSVSQNATELPTKIIKTWTTGKVEYISLTLDMLSDELGNPVSTGTAGTYSNLTVTYNGVVICTDYTLAVGTQVTGEISNGGSYYRLTSQVPLSKKFIIVSRNDAGIAYTLTTNGWNQNTTNAEVTIQTDADGIPCIRNNGTVPDTATWLKWYEYPGYLEQYWGYADGQDWWYHLSFNDKLPDGTDINVYNKKDTVLFAGPPDGNWPIYMAQMYTEPSDGDLQGWTSIRGEYAHVHAYITFDKNLSQFVTVGDDYRMWGEEVYIYEEVPITTATYEALGTTGKVNAGDQASTEVGTSVRIRYPDGSVSVEKVTADMLYLNGQPLTNGDLTSPIRMTGLTLMYNEQILTDNFTLDVLSELENDYPEFPAPGSVRVDKHLGNSGFNFAQTGVSEVHLAVTGTPKANPMDVLVIMDTSSSVVDNFMENGETRLEVMRQALGDLIDTLQAPNPDGTMPDICLAVSQFNDYTYFSENNKLTDYEIFDDRDIPGEYNGKISDFQNVHTMDNFDMSLIQGHGGTNYDVAFQTAYEMLSERKMQYKEIGEREQIVVFMTDGICFQYNYLSYRHGADTNPIWEKWMTGGLTDDKLNYYVTSDVFKQLYSLFGYSGKHWMAEAIKGGADDDTAAGQALYSVIWNEDRNTGATFDTDVNVRNVDGLGATIYSIGFGIDVDGEYNARVGKQVLANIASNPDLYYDANDKDDLRQAFKDIGRSVRKAATDAYIKDQMGKFFDLQMGQVKDSGDHIFAAPSITIRTYDLYKTDDVGTYVNGVLVTTEMVGTRKSATPAATLETIYFSADGKTVTSSALSSDNILSGDVISGKYFYYNTSKTTANNIVVNGKTVSLEPETIYWYIGDILEREVELSYYVYLENSMGENGGRESGTYDTNTYADLHYINVNGKHCKQETQTPKLPWQTATVGYAFYLVDENGNVITNQATGETGGFANRIPVTTVVTKELLLNVDSTQYISQITAGSVLPTGYSLYDPAASYQVHVNSGDIGGRWTITSTENRKPTTYVTGYNGSDFTTDLSSANASYDYSHTTVWFAVTYTVKAMPDSVVIDYGLPVDIHVLINDLFPTSAAVDGIFFGKVEYNHALKTDINQPNVGDEAEGDFGTAVLDKKNGIIRYTLNSANGMQMDKEEVFSYRVPYTYTTMNNGVQEQQERNYYSTVTVIPAANIYYEDNFFTFADSTIKTETHGGWSEAQVNSGTQAEDRPGTDSMPQIDKDYVYGFDQAYANFSQFSLDTFRKVTVNEATGAYGAAPTVKFTFTGTGFDLISLTNSDSGLILVDVVNPADPTQNKSLVVDTYYGYTYNGTDWVVNQSSNDCLYQVPVIKVKDLAYGTYHVTITVAYMSAFDHKQENEEYKEYSFWMDSVRIYNPAGVNGGNNTVISGAYGKDQESNPKFLTIRDILVGAGSFYLNNDTAGAVFIDGKKDSADYKATVADYANQGPNNETYLMGGQAIAFNLVSNTDPAKIQSVQIGAKLAKGNSAELKYGNTTLATLNSATNMFYKLPVLNWTKDETANVWRSSTIVLSNTGADADNIISLTDVKVTADVSVELVTKAARSSEPLTILGSYSGPAIVLCANGAVADEAIDLMDASQNGSGEDLPGDTVPATGDNADHLITMLMLMAVLCMTAVLVLLKLDTQAKKEGRA